MLKIRMARAGTRNTPFYHIVVADSRSPRDGSFLEKLGTYNPKLPRDNPTRVTLNGERIKHWISKGAQTSDRVAIFIGKAGIAPMPERKTNTQKSEPKAKMKDRAKARAEKAEKLAEAAAAPKVEEAPVAETPVVEAPAAEAPAVETAAETETPAA